MTKGSLIFLKPCFYYRMNKNVRLELVNIRFCVMYEEKSLKA